MTSKTAVIFQYICSQAFDMPKEECEEVEGRWLFTRSLKSGNLLLQLAAAFMNGAKVEQDLPMALKCCEHACWCAIGDEIPFASGETFSYRSLMRSLPLRLRIRFTMQTIL